MSATEDNSTPSDYQAYFTPKNAGKSFTLKSWWVKFERELMLVFTKDSGLAWQYTEEFEPSLKESSAINEKEKLNFFDSMKRMIGLSKLIESNLASAKNLGDKVTEISKNINDNVILVKERKNSKTSNRKFIKPVNLESLLLSILYLRHLKRMPGMNTSFGEGMLVSFLNGISASVLEPEKAVLPENIHLLEEEIKAFCNNEENAGIVNAAQKILDEKFAVKLEDVFYETFVEKIHEKYDDAITKLESESDESTVTSSLLETHKNNLKRIETFKKKMQILCTLKQFQQILLNSPPTKEEVIHYINTVLQELRKLEGWPGAIEQFEKTYMTGQGNIFSSVLSTDEATAASSSHLLNITLGLVKQGFEKLQQTSGEETIANIIKSVPGANFLIAAASSFIGLPPSLEESVKTTLVNIDSAIEAENNATSKDFPAFEIDILNDASIDDIGNLIEKADYLSAKLQSTINFLKSYQKNLEKNVDIKSYLERENGFLSSFSRLFTKDTVNLKCYKTSAILSQRLEKIAQKENFSQKEVNAALKEEKKQLSTKSFFFFKRVEDTSTSAEKTSLLDFIDASTQSLSDGASNKTTKKN